VLYLLFSSVAALPFYIRPPCYQATFYESPVFLSVSHGRHNFLLFFFFFKKMMMGLLSNVCIWLCHPPWPSLRQIVCFLCLCLVLYSISIFLVVFFDFSSWL